MTRKKKDTLTRRLFRDPSGQGDLFEKSLEEELEAKANTPVECLGMTFENDEKRREYFLEKLREKLKNPEFRQIEGFPIGSDEDILELSDPPYYTACPNPFIKDFIKHYGKPYDPNVPYSKEPFAADVSEGKTGALYNAHSYHTKVPYLAIKRFIEHFTEPGDLIMDGFAGTGMTGVATLASNQERKSIIIDLSPAASFISNLYNSHVDTATFSRKASQILEKLESEMAPLYATKDTASDGYGVIESVVWSTAMICPSCTGEIAFWDFKETDGGFKCPECGAVSSRNDLEYSIESFLDHFSQKVRKRNKKIPVQITYKIGGSRRTKAPDKEDFEVLERARNQEFTCWFPQSPMLGIGANWGDTYRSGYHRGYENTYDFYFPRTLFALAKLRDEAMSAPRYLRTHILGLLTSVAFAATHLYKYRTKGGGQPAGNNLYIPALIKEQNIISALRRKLKALVAAEKAKEDWTRANIVSTGSSTQLADLRNDCIDYVFVDPPFGANIMYSESSFLWEAWLNVRTNQQSEAIINQTQRKALSDYQGLMTRCFQEFYRVLKPGRWMTVEFHNSQNSVWTSIQESLGHAGFVLADVRTLDKKQGTFKQVTSAGSVKQDLIISAYKPNGGLEERFKLTAGTEEGVWDFVRTHLKQLPVFVSKDEKAEVIAERQNFLLFDRMVAFHVQRGVTVPLSAAEFYAGLDQRFSPREGMYFLPDQVAEYDKKRMTVKEVLQLQLFVSDEASAIQWLKQQITKKPQTFQDIHPQFLKEIGAWQKHEKALELSELLEENFLRYDGKSDVPSQIHSYLSTNFKELRNLAKDDSALRAKGKDRWYVPDPNKASDLEKLRERALMRAFEEYLPAPRLRQAGRESKQKRLKVFRLEAVRAGFKKAWQDRDYATIIAVARKIPEKILQEDAKLLMWYDQALTRTSG